MSDLQPIGVPVTLLDGVERHFLFTLSVIDKVQAHYDKPMISVLKENLGDDRKRFEAINYIAWALINDEISRNNHYLSEKAEALSIEEVGWLIDMPHVNEVNWAILEAYGVSMPKTDDEDEEEDPNRMSRSS